MNERLPVLLRRGYTPREAGFVELAALQSGYFVRRQFNDFIRGKSGAIAQVFVDKALRLGDITGTKYLGGRVVYQFTSFGLYSALGDQNNRNRRLHQNDTIRRRLLALDYCISHPNDYLLTEREKLEYFSERGISETDLPTEVFAEKVRRYFVDRQPIGKNLLFGFIDEGLGGISPWEIFLAKHRSLLQQLPDGVTIFASPREERYPEAERLFRKTITGTDAAGSLDAHRVRGYFEARRQFEAREFGSFTQSRLDRLREDRKVFSGEQIERLFLEWKRVGDAALSHLTGRTARLQLHVLKHLYDWLSPIRKEMSDAADSNAREEGQRGRNRKAG